MLSITSCALFSPWRHAPFDSLHPFHPPLTSGNHQSVLCISEFCLFLILDSTSKWNRAALSSSVWLISLSIMPSGAIYVAANGRISIFLRLNNFPLSTYTDLLCLFICLGTFRLLPYLGYCKQCCSEHGGLPRIFPSQMCSFPVGKYSEVQLLDHMVVLIFIFWGASVVFSVVGALVWISTSSAQVLFSLHSHQLLFVVFLITAILTGVSWYLTVVLICIFLMINGVEHLFIYLLPIYLLSVCLLSCFIV